jgi:hypothetical protein
VFQTKERAFLLVPHKCTVSLTTSGLLLLLFSLKQPTCNTMPLFFLKLLCGRCVKCFPQDAVTALLINPQ